MPKTETIAWMTAAIAKASRVANFSAAGTLPAKKLGLEVQGIGPVELPLKPKVAKQLISVGKVAPFGKGTQTLTDRKVRNSFELSPRQIHLSDDWRLSVETATRQIATELGLPVDQLQAKLYKLLLYERGGFFASHRDSEKLDRMIGSLVIVLPTSFAGGELVVRHEQSEQTFSFPEAAGAKTANYVAFYADCEHEVRRVTRGRRFALTYNLTLKKPSPSKRQSPKSQATESNPLMESLRSWIAARPAEPLVCALEHQYTEKGLAVDLLKGADRAVAKLITDASAATGCRAYFAQVTRHLQQYADDGSFGRGRHWGYRKVDTEELMIGEAYEDDLTGEAWCDLQGKRQRFGPLPLAPTAIVCSGSLADWKPTSEEYEGYTGNAGNTLDRWYHRSAIVLWHEDHHFDVLARSGSKNSIDLYLSMVGKLVKAPKKRLEAARHDCFRLAKAIIGRWPKRRSRSFGARQSDESPWLKEFGERLLDLDCKELIGEFLATVAQRDKRTSLKTLVSKACCQYGIDTFAVQLEQLLTLHEKYDMEIALRDIQWLCIICCDRKLSCQKTLLKRLCSLATNRFSESYVQVDQRYRYRPPEHAHQALPFLVKALLAIGVDSLLAKLIDAIRSNPQSFSLGQAQVPCLKTVVPWFRKREKSAHPVLESWLEQVDEELRIATQEKPSPPSDWARPAKVECNCRFCGQLNEFLRDPQVKTTRIAASEQQRHHLTHNISKYRCDASHKLEKKGRPYALVLTKTKDSHERLLKEYATNVKLLKSLASIGKRG